MYASRDILYIRSHRAGTFVRRNRPPKPASFRVPCKFCETRITRTNPGSITIQEKCRVCNGTGKIILEGDSDNYQVCKTCLGTGRDSTTEVGQPCHACQGSGLVKVGRILVNNG